jgi:outer membrane protein OmpA-like peptidoglycan-associated protein
MPIVSKRLVLLLFISALAACVPMMPGPDADRLLVYFDEFSADLSPDALRTINDAAKRARDINARRIRIEGRASATGSPEANKKLAETRTQVVADELMKDGIPKPMIWQVPIGQTGSGDPGVAERRVDIVLEH